MPEVLSDPRLRNLLVEADRLLDLLRTPTPERPVDDVMINLDVLHRDLGRRLHDLWQLGILEAAEAAAEPVDDLDEIDVVEPIDEDVAGARDAAFQGAYEGAWVDDLQDFLALIDAPTDDRDAVSLAIESARIQWATVGLDQRWPRFPEPIQLAMLGMLAARSRFLCEHMACDLGPRLALRRLARYRNQAGLSTVVALVDERDPESGTWTTDALQWWDLLAAGLQA